MDVFTAERTKIGAGYRYAGHGPTLFDCVGLQVWGFTAAGRADLVDGSWTVGHLADLYRFTGRATANIGAARAGDMIVYGSYEHVALMLPDGQVIAAEVPVVRVHPLLDTWYGPGTRMPPTLVLRTGYGTPAPGPTPPGPTPPPAPGPAYRYHQVQRGETLWGIAAAMLGRGSRYPEIVALNLGTIPADPHLLRAGTVLKIPPP